MIINYVIIAITVIVSLLAWNQPELFAKLKFNPYIIKNNKEYWRLGSYGLIHADWMHLGINMFVLWSFGSIVVQYFQIIFPGKAIFYYLVLYIGGLLVANASSFGKHKENPYYSAVGASGAVSAILFSSIVLNPMGRIYLFLIPVGIPAIIFGILYLVYSVYMDKKAQDNVGHDAHFWGGVFGFVFTIALKPDLIQHFFYEIFG